MREKKTEKIQFNRKRYAQIADKYYNEGDYLAALRFAHREYREYGGDFDVYARLCDIYEAMGLQGTAINYWYKLLHIAREEDLPDVYEGLGANYLSLGNERQAAYYYNKLIDVDDTLPEETRMDVAEAFSKDKKSGFRFVYPPELADYSEQLALGTAAFKRGEFQRAIASLDEVPKESKDFTAAKELQAIAYLLNENAEAAERSCLELLEGEPEEIRALATLAAVYLESGRTEEALALAKKLSAMQTNDRDEGYKIATVCCENGLHEQAYEWFSKLERETAYDGRMLYFKGVAAYKCGKLDEAEDALFELCEIYPDAEVARYYLRAIRQYRREIADGKACSPPELTYLYHLPQEEREERSKILLRIGECPKDEAQLFGLIVLHDGYFTWCFDEMDGGDRELQYLALVTANHVRADEFIQDVLLDFEVADVLKVECLRMLIERNEEMDVGVVLCHIYKLAKIRPIAVGRKRRKRFVEGYARVLSKFIMLDENYAKKVKRSTEKLYALLEENGGLDLASNPDELACAIYLYAGFRELGQDQATVAAAFNANVDRVGVLLSYTIPRFEGEKNETY